MKTNQKQFKIGQILDKSTGFVYHGKVRTGLVSDVQDWGVRLQLFDHDNPEQLSNQYKAFRWEKMK